jgi:DNA-binding CsgD family transcriptional regulator/PAS domain-containing protein
VIQPNDLSDVLAGLYDCALDPAGWEHIPAKIARLVRSERCILHTRDSITGICSVVAVTGSLLTASASKYADHYFKQDVFAPGALRRGVGVASISQDLVSDEDMLVSEFYQDFCRHLGIFHGACAFIPVDQTLVGAIGIGRPRREAAFESEDRAVLQLLIPHLSRVLQLERRLRDCREGRRVALGALEAMGCGVLLVAGSGRLLFANATADRLLRKRQAIALRNGWVHALQGEHDARLQRAIQAAAAGGSGDPFHAGGTLMLPRPSGGPLSLLVCPVPSDALPDLRQHRPVIIFVSDPDDARLPAAALLRKVYDLTPSEARLAAALAEGKRLQEYAEEAGITVNTAKTQLKQVFTKTGSDRQSDLIRNITSNLVLRMQGRNR